MKTDIVKESLRRLTGRKMTRIIRKPWVLCGFVHFPYHLIKVYSPGKA